MEIRPTRPRVGSPGSSRAFTLVEMLVSVALGGLILAAIGLVTLYSLQSFAAMGNYADLERASSVALDRMSRDIRRTQELVSFATNRLEFLDMDGNSLVYEWSPGQGTLTERRDGVSTVLLQQCDFLRFRISQRNPSNNFEFYPAPANRPDLAKLVDVSWRCSRQIRGQQLNTESVQTAKIVIRN